MSENYGINDKYPTIIQESVGKDGIKKIKTTFHQRWIHDYRGIKFFQLTGVCPTYEKDKWNNAVIWLWRCDCGKYMKASSVRVKQGHPKSCGCLLIESAREKGKKSAKDITGQKFGSLTALKPTNLRKNQKVVWECKCDCGNICYVPTYDLTSLSTCSCGCNKTSVGERIISQLLSKNNIPFIKQKRFEGCRDKLTLPFDFYVQNKYLIEFDGEQHERKESLYFNEDIIKHDKIKNNFCKNNNIPLIRIPYKIITKLKIEDLLLESSSFIVKE